MNNQEFYDKVSKGGVPVTAHTIAEWLLQMPDLPVVINGWGSDEGLGVRCVSKIHIDGDSLMLDYDD